MHEADAATARELGSEEQKVGREMVELAAERPKDDHLVRAGGHRGGQAQLEVRGVLVGRVTFERDPGPLELDEEVRTDRVEIAHRLVRVPAHADQPVCAAIGGDHEVGIGQHVLIRRGVRPIRDDDCLHNCRLPTLA